MAMLRKVWAWLVTYLGYYFVADSPLMQTPPIDIEDPHPSSPSDIFKPGGGTLVCPLFAGVSGKERVLELDRTGGAYWRSLFHTRNRIGSTVSAATPLQSVLSLIGIQRSVYSLYEFNGIWVLAVKGGATAFKMIDDTFEHFVPWLMRIGEERRADVEIRVIDHLYNLHTYVFVATDKQSADTQPIKKKEES